MQQSQNVLSRQSSRHPQHGNSEKASGHFEKNMRALTSHVFGELYPGLREHCRPSSFYNTWLCRMDWKSKENSVWTNEKVFFFWRLFFWQVWQVNATGRQRLGSFGKDVFLVAKFNFSLLFWKKDEGSLVNKLNLGRVLINYWTSMKPDHFESGLFLRWMNQWMNEWINWPSLLCTCAHHWSTTATDLNFSREISSVRLETSATRK